MTMLVPELYSQKMGWILNDWMEGIWKETAMVYSRYWPTVCIEGLSKTTKNLIRCYLFSCQDSTIWHPKYECRNLPEMNMKIINIITCVTEDGVWIGD